MHSAADNCKPVDVVDTLVQLAHGIDGYSRALEVAYMKVGQLVAEAVYLQVEPLVAEAAH